MDNQPSDQTEEFDPNYWYENRRNLQPGQIFKTVFGGMVKLDRTVPGDGTKWYAADWHNGWAYYDGTVEPGDLCSFPLPEPVKDPTQY